MILYIYADYDKRIGAYKIAYILGCVCGLYISVGQVYRLMHCMQIPPMSTVKTKSISRTKELSDFYVDCHYTKWNQHSGSGKEIQPFPENMFKNRVFLLTIVHKFIL